MQPQEPINYDQPVAYDRDGRPLYAHPPVMSQAQPAATEQVVHITRAVDPAQPLISTETAKRHEDSAAKYPTLNLSKEEYIISEVRRHPIGLAGPVALAGLLLLAILGFLALYKVIVPSNNPPLSSIILPALLLILLLGLGLYIVVWVYINNKFFLTNESVIQEIQVSLFTHNEQTVSLGNIEDASYTQTGLIQTLFNYGSIRLSTEGDETTYRFFYVADPKQQIATLNNAVEAFKNGRPTSD